MNLLGNDPLKRAGVGNLARDAAGPSAPNGEAMAGSFSIALALEVQLRLDDQPALNEAVSLASRHRGGS
jgi:hypothetical protein